jgi:hypothetical protein
MTGVPNVASNDDVQAQARAIADLQARVTKLEGGTAPTPPPADYTLIVETPKNGDTLTGAAVFSGTAPAMKNVEIWDGTTMLLATVPDANGKWSVIIDTTKYPDGHVNWVVHTWDVPAGQVPSHAAELDMNFVLKNGNATASGRTYLLGFYGGPPQGMRADFTLDGSFQEHRAGGGVYLASPTYPVVVDIDGGQYDMAYADIASGKHDNDINATLNSIPANARQAIYAFRIDREFNLYSNWLSATPKMHRDAMNHLCDLIRAQYKGIPIIWNPNALNGGDISDRIPEKADIIGVDAYANPVWKNTADVLLGNPSGPAWGTLRWWSTVAHKAGKPLALPEWGDDYGDGIFVNAIADFANDPNNSVVLMSYWNSNDSEPAALRGASLDAFNKRFGGTQYNGSFWKLKPIDNSLPGY